MRLGPLRLLIPSVALAAAAVACATGDGPTAPPRSAPLAPGDVVASGGATDSTTATGTIVDGTLTPVVGSLLYCPASESATTAGTIGPEGGVLRVGGHRVSVPAGAVAESTTFVMTVPAGQYLEVDVSAMGVEHYTFRAPVAITLDFSRCPLYLGPYRAWYIDTTTKALLEDMGGVSDLLSRTHTFQTGHLSGYAVAT